MIVSRLFMKIEKSKQTIQKLFVDSNHAIIFEVGKWLGDGRTTFLIGPEIRMI